MFSLVNSYKIRILINTELKINKVKILMDSSSHSSAAQASFYIQPHSKTEILTLCLV
jgi:hypothetical protein